jgi:hypothetical protein
MELVRSSRADVRMLLNRLQTYDRPGSLLEVAEAMNRSNRLDEAPVSRSDSLGQTFNSR